MIRIRGEISDEQKGQIKKNTEHQKGHWEMPFQKKCLILKPGVWQLSEYDWASMRSTKYRKVFDVFGQLAVDLENLFDLEGLAIYENLQTGKRQWSANAQMWAWFFPQNSKRHEKQNGKEGAFCDGWFGRKKKMQQCVQGVKRQQTLQSMRFIETYSEADSQKNGVSRVPGTDGSRKLFFYFAKLQSEVCLGNHCFIRHNSRIWCWVRQRLVRSCLFYQISLGEKSVPQKRGYKGSSIYPYFARGFVHLGGMD